MALHPCAESFRAEIGRHMLLRVELAKTIGMTSQLFTDYLNGNKPLPDWAAHNIALAINCATGMRLFHVAQLGKIDPPRGRPPSRGFRGYGLKPYTPRRKRRKKKSSTAIDHAA